MSRLIFDLRGVPDDEADEVRALLDAERVDYYETRPAPLGLFAGGLWLRENTEYDRAKALLAGYQLQRRAAALARQAEAERDGTRETFWASLARHPVRVIAVLLGIVFIVGFTLLPYLLFGGANPNR